MDNWQRRVLLENIIYKIFKRKILNDKEKKMIKEIISARDCGKVPN